MHWLKQVEPKNYQQLQSTYTCSLEKLYQRDLDRFFEDAFVRVNGSGASVVASQVLKHISTNQDRGDSKLFKVFPCNPSFNSRSVLFGGIQLLC